MERGGDGDHGGFSGDERVEGLNGGREGERGGGEMRVAERILYGGALSCWCLLLLGFWVWERVK